MQVCDALLSDLFYDWLKKWQYHDINQPYYGVRMPVVLRGLTQVHTNRITPTQMTQTWKKHYFHVRSLQKFGEIGYSDTNPMNMFCTIKIQRYKYIITRHLILKISMWWYIVIYLYCVVFVSIHSIYQSVAVQFADKCSNHTTLIPDKSTSLKTMKWIIIKIPKLPQYDFIHAAKFYWHTDLWCHSSSCQ